MAAADFYSILQIERTATQAEVRTAYFKLAKVYHPDVQDDASEDATEIFLAIQNAYQTLMDPKERLQYDAALDQGGAAGAGSAKPDRKKSQSNTPNPGEQRKASIEESRDARLAVMKVENLLEVGDVETALQIMAAVVRTVPDEPDYQSLYGYTLALNGQRLHAARDYCRRALAAEPHNADRHAYLGYVYLRAGLKKSAEQCFEEALRLNPTHQLACENMGSNSGSEGGLFSGLRRIFSR